MPYRVKKVPCKSADDNSGSWIVQKREGDTWKKVSCHSSKSKAEASIRARHVNESEESLREAIRSILTPDWEFDREITLAVQNSDKDRLYQLLDTVTDPNKRLRIWNAREAIEKRIDQKYDQAALDSIPRI